MSATLFVAIGAGIAVLTGIGAGVGIGKATSSAVELLSQDSLKQKAKSVNLCFLVVPLPKQQLFTVSLLPC